ncbi:MAG: twin-arginine translocase TatA/TatE family subunit [Nitriliruptoraceae bacterium]
MPGIQELLVIAIVALLVFGPERLPELARRAGHLVVKVRGEAERNISAFRAAADLDDLEDELRAVGDELRGGRRVTPRSTGPAPRTRRPSPPRTGTPPTDPDAT